MGKETRHLKGITEQQLLGSVIISALSGDAVVCPKCSASPYPDTTTTIDGKRFFWYCAVCGEWRASGSIKAGTFEP